jgi:hypothetical protein
MHMHPPEDWRVSLIRYGEVGPLVILSQADKALAPIS